MATFTAHATQPAPTASTATPALASPTANANANPANQKIASQVARMLDFPPQLPALAAIGTGVSLANPAASATATRVLRQERRTAAPQILAEKMKHA
jgi:hypothetical protein